MLTPDDYVHDLAPLLAASVERPHAITFADPQPPVGRVLSLAAAGAPAIVHRFNVVRHGFHNSPDGSIRCVFLAPIGEQPC